MLEGSVVEGVVNNDLINRRAGSEGKRNQGTVREMSATPEIDRGSISVSGDEFGPRKVNKRKVVVVFR